MSLSKPYAATALAHVLISLGHTMTAPKFMTDPQFQRLPRLVRMYSRAGWFQGSAWFLIAGLLNYRWAKAGGGALTDPLERAIAALTTAVYWATAVWYTKEGDAGTAGILTVAGGMQTYAAFLS